MQSKTMQMQSVPLPMTLGLCHGTTHGTHMNPAADPQRRAWEAPRLKHRPSSQPALISVVSVFLSEMQMLTLEKYKLDISLLPFI